MATEVAARNDNGQQTLPNPKPIEEGVRGLLHQLRVFLVALWLSPGRRSLALLIIGTVFVICATAAAQVGLNAGIGRFTKRLRREIFRRFCTSSWSAQPLPAAFSSSTWRSPWLREMS
jgi:ABC-type uncharacterized transport system fused permease/ATPase subunit